MKFTNLEIRSSLEALKELVKKEFPAVTSFRIKKLMKSLNDAYTTYAETHDELIKKHAKKDEKGELVFSEDDIPGSISLEDPVSYQKEEAELLREKQELDITPLSISDLGNVQISPSTLLLGEKVFIE